MARKYPKRRQDPPLRITGTRGFGLGLNQLTHATTIQDNELVEAQNIFYSQNGVLSKRPGTANIGLVRGTSTNIMALGSVYDIGTPATDYLLRISDDGILQKYSFSSETWLDVAGSPTFPNSETQILQAYGFVYLLNKDTTIVKWDGASFITFTALANPTTAPTLLGLGAVATISIAAGGTGYSVNDVLKITGGGNDCTVKVVSVSAGVVTGVTIITAGTGYSVSNTNATTVNPAAGVNCTLNILTLVGAGSTTFFYRYVWYNDVGNTLASTAGSVANMPETLDASLYVKITVPSAPVGATRVGIFRGTIAGEEVYLDYIPPTQTVYYDKFFVDTDPLYGVPASNTTSGFHFKFAAVYRDTLIGVTTEEGDDSLVFSAGGDKFDSFGRADGGGYYAWREGDGDPISGVAPFQEELYVFKTSKVGSFTFDADGGAVKDINLAVGAVSHRSIHAAGNDLRFWSREGAMSLGNEPNFANIIRTKVLSARAQKIVDALSPSEFSQISGVYYKGLSLWGIPMGGVGGGITSTIVYDEKYVAWSEWVGMQPRSWAKFIDSGAIERLYFADAQSGNVCEAWQGTDDRGEAVVMRVATKQFDMNKPWQYKTYVRVYFIFGNVTGTNTRITMVEDGERTQVPLALYASTGKQGFGIDEFGTMEFGDSSGEFEGETSGLMVRYIDIGNKDLFSLQAILQNDGLVDQIEFMGIFIQYRDSSRPLPSTMQLQRVQEA